MYIHITHKKDEIKFNLMVAKKLADNGITVHLLPYRTAGYIKNPDARLNNLIGEFKHPKNATSHNTLRAHIAAAHKQGAAVVVIYIDNPRIDARMVSRAIGNMKDKEVFKNVKQVWLLNVRGQLTKINRAHIQRRDYRKQLLGVGLK